MKKIIFFFLLGINLSYGQITFAGATFNLNPTPSIFADAGTNSYSYSVTVPGDATYTITLFRYDGYWYQLESSKWGKYWNYRTENQVLTPHPPCSVKWHGRYGIAWTPSLPVSSPNHPAIPPSSLAVLQNITGSTCSPLPSILSGTMTAFYFLPPSLSTTDILAISSPPAGAIVWDFTAGCLKVFNGTAWVCL